MQLSKKQKGFLNILLYSLNLNKIFSIFLKKMTLIAYLFPKLGTAKDVAR